MYFCTVKNNYVEIIENLKANILFNLECINDKMKWCRVNRQVITLSSAYQCVCGTEYFLQVHLIVYTIFDETKIGITNFEIYEFVFFKDKGDRPSFNFSHEELMDYIDF